MEYINGVLQKEDKKERVYAYVGMYGIEVTDLNGREIALCDGADNGDDLIDDLWVDAEYCWDIVKRFDSREDLDNYLKSKLTTK